MSLTVAYIGNFEPEYSTENDVRKALESMGHDVICQQENRADGISINYLMPQADLLLWTSTWDDTWLASNIDRIRYECAYSDVVTAALHLDVFWGTDRGGRPWWTNPMWKLQHAFTADGDHQAEFERFGVNHHWLPPGVRHDACHDGQYRDEYACDVAFVGSNGVGYHEDVWPYRRQLVDELRAMCARRGWTFRNPGGDEPKIDRNDDMNDFYASAKVTVGDSLCPLKDDSRYWSDRVYEATGRGGFLIMPRLLELGWGGTSPDVGFYPNLPTYPWGAFDNLEDEIGFWLDHPADRETHRQRIAVQTRERHTYVNRMQTLLRTVGLA